MKHALLIGMLLTLAVVGGSVKDDPVTILKVRVIPLRLPMPTLDDEVFTPRDVVPISGNAQR
jgi:hypothetical protein